MRLLFLLLWRNNFTIFFILLQSICLYLLVRNNRFQQASVLNATNKVVTTTMEGVNYVKEYIHLRDNNNLLAEENAKLRALLNEAQYDNDSTAITIKDSVSVQQYLFKENGLWKVVTADNRARDFFLKRNPNFKQQFQLTQPQFAFREGGKQNGKWTPLGQPPTIPR